MISGVSWIVTEFDVQGRPRQSHTQRKCKVRRNLIHCDGLAAKASEPAAFFAVKSDFIYGKSQGPALTRIMPYQKSGRKLT